MSFFSSRGWESWDIASRPLIPERMPVLVDDDLLLEDGPGAPRPSVTVNQWLRELPASGCPSPGSWESYARVLKEWAEFLSVHGVALFGSREQLKLALGKYAEYRAAGPAERRFAATTWGRHMGVLSLFYRWAMDEGHAQAEPFTYRTARAVFAGTGREVRVNLAVRRIPKPHVTIKYLEPDFVRLFLDGLRGLGPGGEPDPCYRGRELARNAAVGELALATGLRLQEFSSLLAWEIPPLPSRPVQAPIPFPVPASIAKGRKFRTTWIFYDALAAVHHYLELDRPATVGGTGWRPPSRWGGPLLVTEPDERGGRVNGVRRRWETLTPGERRRLVAPDGGTCILAAKAGGGPFTAWASVFERTADRIRARSEPRFPRVSPHRLRHSFSMRTLEYLVSGHYRQAAEVAQATDRGEGPPAGRPHRGRRGQPRARLPPAGHQPRAGRHGARRAHRRGTRRIHRGLHRPAVRPARAEGPALPGQAVGLPGCPLAIFAPRHAASLLRLKAFFSRQWQQMPSAQFMAVFGPYSQRVAQVLDRYDPAVLGQAARNVTDDDAGRQLAPHGIGSWGSRQSADGRPK